MRNVLKKLSRLRRVLPTARRIEEARVAPARGSRPSGTIDGLPPYGLEVVGSALHAPPVPAARRGERGNELITRHAWVEGVTIVVVVSVALGVLQPTVSHQSTSNDAARSRLLQNSASSQKSSNSRSGMPTIIASIVWRRLGPKLEPAQRHPPGRGGGTYQPAPCSPCCQVKTRSSGRLNASCASELLSGNQPPSSASGLRLTPTPVCLPTPCRWLTISSVP